MATYTVGPSGDYATMSAAIAAATAGDTLQVLAAYSFDPASEAYQYVHINKDNLTIESQAGTPSGATISTAPPSPHTRTVINIHVGTTGTVLRNLTLRTANFSNIIEGWVSLQSQRLYTLGSVCNACHRVCQLPSSLGCTLHVVGSLGRKSDMSIKAGAGMAMSAWSPMAGFQTTS